MKTNLTAAILATEAGREADSILRACVHCGFCTATCPTYRVSGSELDSPRGRISLIKAMLEGQPVSDITQTHLDRCLSCQSCETTCPSGVNYHRLLDIGRNELAQRVRRKPGAGLMRWCIRKVLPWRRRFTLLLQLGQWLRPLLPAALAKQMPLRRGGPSAVAAPAPRKVILVQGCVQPGLSPRTNAAAIRVLNALGIQALTVAREHCCGAISYHLDAQAEGLEFARRNIDAWWPYVQNGVTAIVMTATGCGNFIQSYGELLRDDPHYREKANRVVSLLRDISQVLAGEDLEKLPRAGGSRISWHCPCTAQHGQKLDATTRQVLNRLGYEIPQVRDAHLCCGSAGTHSLLHSAMATELRQRKLAALEASAPEHIITANIGCQIHLAAATSTPVTHWIELVARSL